MGGTSTPQTCISKLLPNYQLVRTIGNVAGLKQVKDLFPCPGLQRLNVGGWMLEVGGLIPESRTYHVSRPTPDASLLTPPV
jgi:hypothetical protein